MCAGFTDEGMPLPMQIVGRPFDDSTVLNAGYAYEAATEWRGRRPQLVDGAPPRPVDPPPMTADASHVDEEIRRMAEMAVKRAGLSLSDAVYDQVLEAAPHVLAMAGRIRGDYGFGDEPANIWRFDAAMQPRPGHLGRQAAD